VTKLTSPGEQPEQGMRKLPKHQALKALVYPFKVIVSPFNAFKEIAQNPDFKGLGLIVGLILLTTMSVYYTQSSKVFLSVSERQPISPKLYTYVDAYVYVTAFGNYTFQSSQPYAMNYTFIDKTPLIGNSLFLVNATELLTPTEPMVTVANDTFYQTNVKLNQSTRNVGNFTLTIKFYSNTTPTITTLLTKTAQWDLGNFTINWFILSPYTYLANVSTAIDLASKATLSFLKTNVSRAELGNTASPNNWMRSIFFDWSDHGNATLYGGNYARLMDSGPWLEVVFDVNGTQTKSKAVGLTYSSFLSTSLFIDSIPILLMEAAFAFSFSWLIYTGILLLVMRAFGGRGGSWRSFIVFVGYAFSVNIIQLAIGAILFATFPEVHLQVASWPPAQQDVATVNLNLSETWGPTPSYKALTYVTLPYLNIIDVWLLMLNAIAVRAFSGAEWRKAFMISTTAFLIRFLLRLFIGL